MSKYTHVMVVTLGFQGYWGKGTTLREAIRNARWIKSQDRVQVIQCDADTRIDAMGGIVYREMYNTVGTGKVNHNCTAVMMDHIQVTSTDEPKENNNEQHA